MKDIAIIGKGGFGREVRMLLDQINAVKAEWNFIGYYDDETYVTPLDGYPQLGTISNLNNRDGGLNIAFGIGSPSIKRKIAGFLTNESLRYPNLFHPNLIFDSENFIFGKGNIICANCIVSTNVKMSDFISINLSSTIGHDVTIQSFCSVNPGANISGHVTVKRDALIGTNSCIIQGLVIGEKAVVGAGAVTLRDVADGNTVIGNPARAVKKS